MPYEVHEVEDVRHVVFVADSQPTHEASEDCWCEPEWVDGILVHRAVN